MQLWANLWCTDHWLFWVAFALYWCILGTGIELMVKRLGWDKAYTAQQAIPRQLEMIAKKLSKKRGYKRRAKNIATLAEELKEEEN